MKDKSKNSRIEIHGRLICNNSQENLRNSYEKKVDIFSSMEWLVMPNITENCINMSENRH